jgi:hypothetical protein
MKRFRYLFAILILILASNVTAISSDLKDSYLQHETIIGKLQGSILSPITREQVNLVKDGHLQVGFDYDIKEINEEEYIWLGAPQNPGNYTLIIKDVLAIQDGTPQVIEYRKDFVVGNSSTDYSIQPGIIVSDKDFEIEATLYQDFPETIGISFPESRSVLLNPGVNKIDFSIEDVVGEQVIQIAVGKYSVPAFIVGKESLCGDGRIDGEEVCDGNNLSGKSCTTIQGGFIGGDLACSNDCLSFDMDGCDVEEGAVCDLRHLGLCTHPESCSDVGRFWYDSRCNEEEPETGCDSRHLNSCANEDECGSAGGVWHNSACWPDLDYYPIDFQFNPAIIKSTALRSESPTYVFEIKNLGKGTITNIQLGYDARVFSIQPNRNLSIEPNKSLEFSLGLKNVSDGGVRGVIYGYYGNLTKYLLIKVDFTSDESQVSTDYLRDNSGNTGYYCSEIPRSTGAACGSDEVCKGEEISTLDITKCCVGTCEAQSSGSSAWLGYLIAAILVLGLAYIFMRYRKTGKKKNPLNEKVAELEKKLP